MCGIAGFCNFGIDYSAQERRWREVLVAMRQSIAHRGSDQTGEFLDRHVGLGHTRLSIRDLEMGAQPMTRRVGGAEYTVVYNGELYNTDELKAALEPEHFTYETTCDTEVLLLAYIALGPDFARQLNGIFSFAIWDGAANRLLLGRDQLGVKPLFYALRDGTLVFGSEPKALFHFPGLQPEVDADSFREIFGVGPARTAGCGVFKGVREVRPGCIAVFDRDGFREEPYWGLVSTPHTDSYDETVSHVGWLVRDAIRRQMVSDVPVCTFLSGGIDSSIVTAVAARKLAEDGVMLNTFSFDFRGNAEYFHPNSFQPAQDRPFVERMLDACSTHHTYLECDEELLAALLDDAVLAKDLPGMADVDASLLYFCSLVARHNKVALTGECADEIFGGYPWFYRPELLNCGTFPWSRDLSPRTMLLEEAFARSLDLPDYVHARYEQTLQAVPQFPGEPEDEQRRREISYLNIRWFMTTLLDRMDRTSMYWGLEARVPFADHRIVEYLWNVPWSMKYRDGTEKHLLRAACGDLLPKEIAWRKKSPYPKTYSPAYERALARRFEQILQDANAPVRPLLDEKKARAFLKTPAEYGKPWFGQLMAAPQLMAYLIQVNFWLKQYHLSF